MQQDGKLTLTVTEVARCLGVSRGLAYEMARQNKLPILKLGHRRLLIPKKQFEDFLAGQWQPPVGDTD